MREPACDGIDEARGNASSSDFQIYSWGAWDGCGMAGPHRNTQPIDGVASGHRAANRAESDQADRPSVPAVAALADCTTAHVQLP